MLANLGFSDKDKDSDHDDACAYLRSHPEKLSALHPGIDFKDQRGDRVRRTYGPTTWALTAATEVALSKGHGQYKTTVGFLDVVIYREKSAHLTYEEIGYGGNWTKEEEDVVNEVTPLLVEVKAKHVSEAEVLRQISLYRQYVEGVWFVVVLFEPSLQFVEELSAADIVVVKLGTSFREWLAGRLKAKATVAEL